MMEEMLRCRICGTLQAAVHFGLLPSGNRRCICNHCRYLYVVLPDRRRRLLRELSARTVMCEEEL